MSTSTEGMFVVFLLWVDRCGSWYGVVYFQVLKSSVDHYSVIYSEVFVLFQYNIATRVISSQRGGRRLHSGPRFAFTIVLSGKVGGKDGGGGGAA